jgi:hypothetical protein
VAKTEDFKLATDSVSAAALVVQDPDVFEPHQGLDDVARVREDEGASCFLSHISSLEHLCSIPGGPKGTARPRQIPMSAFVTARSGVQKVAGEPTDLDA